jgi:hypothetical protein
LAFFGRLGVGVVVVVVCSLKPSRLYVQFITSKIIEKTNN